MLNALRHRILLEKRFSATWLLIAINVGFYLFICAQSENFLSTLVSGPSSETLVLYGAKENGLIALGQIDRLFLPMFLHANLIHLLVNMISLWFVGRIFEFFAGARNLFLVYAIAGVTGNLCSFALLPALSVGASGSLFGILLCLYVIQKYEEHLAKIMKRGGTGMRLGGVILFNILLNIGFGLTYPIFDWACHLGGSLAGLLCGFALTSRHSYSLNAILTPGKQIKRKIFSYPQLYFAGIAVVNVLFALSYLNVKESQKIGGLALELAGKTTTALLTKDDLAQYSDILVRQNPETNPENMLQGALWLQQNGDFYAASTLYQVLLFLHGAHFGSTAFVSPQTRRLLEIGQATANMGRPLPENALVLQQSRHQALFVSVPDICAKPAALFMTLGFYGLSAKLYDCAYALNTKERSYAVKAIASFLLARKDKTDDPDSGE